MTSSKRNNKPLCKDPPSLWPDNVWTAFSNALTRNKNRDGNPYYVKSRPLGELPPALLGEYCHNPKPEGSNTITVCVNDMQYNRPIHRIRMMLRCRELGNPIPNKEEQCSHLCLDEVNIDGKGSKHCTNPEHMVIEDDRMNKSRQRCAGWVWIHPYHNHDGGYWYPTCTHNPPCIRYKAKEVRPVQLKQ